MGDKHKLPMVPFNRPAFVGKELEYIQDAIHNRGGISGNGYYLKQCEAWFRAQLNCNQALLTSSCTHALEIAAILLELKSGDEIIMPSYTFVTTANSFVLHGGTPVFVDIRPDTMNIDEELIEAAITPRTRAIVAMHYGGIACNMERIMEIAQKHKLVVIEDAAQAVFSHYRQTPLGKFGHMATFSFHETKNYTSGEGGLLVVNDPSYSQRAEIIRQKGTNRDQMFRGEVDKYSWVDIGSSYVMSELNAAYLYAQLEAADTILAQRRNIWQTYHDGLRALEGQGLIALPHVPDNCGHNAHLFYIKARDLETRTALIDYLKNEECVHAVFHYVPLHSSPAGKKFARFHGQDRFTTKESERLLRLPLHYNMTMQEAQRVIDAVQHFYSARTGKEHSKALETTV